jgi:hypothetical protein
MPIRPVRAATGALACMLLIATASLAGCGDDPSAPVVVPEAQLHVVVQAPTAPALTATVVAVWVKRGVDKEIRLHYRPRLGVADSTEFLRLRFDDHTLLARRDGSRIAMGDSVLVTLTVPDPTKFLVNLEPTGLRFNPDEPAELRWKLADSDDDLDDDDDVDPADVALYSSLAVWRQETVGQPWAKLVSRLTVESDQIEAELVGFSNYVVAYRSTRPTAEP